MNFNSYYLYAKKFVEETVNAKDKADKPFVEEYMEEILLVNCTISSYYRLDCCRQKFCLVSEAFQHW